MKTDLEVEVEVDLRPLDKVIIFRDKQTHRTFLLYIDHQNQQHMANITNTSNLNISIIINIITINSIRPCVCS